MAVLFGVPIALLASVAVVIYLLVSIRITGLELTVAFGIEALAYAAIWLALWRQDRRFPWAAAAAGLGPVLTLAAILAPRLRWILLAYACVLAGSVVTKLSLGRLRQHREVEDG
jgi:hypothetical protein